ncbi:MAG: hypothetical protein ACTHNK_00775 [Thermomicrobiales bacterium]
MLVVAFVCFFILVLAWFFAAGETRPAAHEPAPAALALDQRTSAVS